MRRSRGGRAGRPRDSKIQRVLLLLVNDPSDMLPIEKQRDANSISYYYLYSEDVSNHLKRL